jgi:tRNA threonylcarbamoyladenosine biosynthesis protein TsaB
MYILHIETSTKICSVAISRDDQVVAWEEKGDSMNHAASLAPMIDGLLKKFGLSSGELGAVSVSSGPGSYTGLRVGSSTAKAMAYSLGIPLIAVPTLESLALAVIERQPSASHFLPMIDARRDEVYASLFDGSLSILWPDHAVQVGTAFMEEHLVGLREVVCCGDGAFKVKPFQKDYSNLTVTEELCSARHLVKPAWNRISNKETEDPLHFIPSYLKPPNITQPRKTA